MAAGIVAIDEYKVRFAVAAVHVPVASAGMARTRIKAELLPGQRALHLKKDLKHRGPELIAATVAMAELGVYAEIHDAAGRRESDVHERQRCLCSIVERSRGTTELIIDRDESEERRDHRTIVEARHRIDHRITYHHEHRNNEPLLWLADIVVGCYGRGGPLCRAIAPLINEVILLH